VLIKFKQISLVICLFLFLLVVLGGGLHLSPAGAFLAAATGTPLVIHVFSRWRHISGARDQLTPWDISSSSLRVVGVNANDACGFEKKHALRG
jgi:hypothetical protein